MAIYKRCPRCGKRIQEGSKCIECTKAVRAASNRTDGIRREYHSKRWRRLREKVLNQYDHLDLYAYYHDGRIVPATCVHHIREALDDPDYFYAEGNHFPTSEESHAEIHRRYKEEGAAKVRGELVCYLVRYRDERFRDFEAPEGRSKKF